MTIVAIEDNRNVEWAKNNKGSMLLQKMGWNQGDGIGKRTTNQTTTALRALKRKESLGLGASIPTEGGNSESTGHFSDVLKNLRATHGSSTTTTTTSTTREKNSRKEKRRKTTTTTETVAPPTLTLAQNRCNAGRKKIRESKFATMSAEDMAAVFGNRDFKPVVMNKKDDDNEDTVRLSPSTSTTDIPTTAPSNDKSGSNDKNNDSSVGGSGSITKKRKSKSEKKSKKDKKKRKRNSSSSSDTEDGSS